MICVYLISCPLKFYFLRSLDPWNVFSVPAVKKKKSIIVVTLHILSQKKLVLDLVFVSQANVFQINLLEFTNM